VHSDETGSASDENLHSQSLASGLRLGRIRFLGAPEPSTCVAGEASARGDHANPSLGGHSTTVVVES
jgi:hypothetical protein